MKYLLIVFLFISTNLFAQFDLNLGASGRSYPSIGGDLSASLGYNFVLWGEGNKSNPLYGLIRPAIDLSSSAVINSYTTKIEFFPISFFGIVAGKESTISNYKKFTYYDCDNVRCEGNIDRDFLTFKLALAYGPLVAMGSISNVKNTYSFDSQNPNTPVAEFRYATVVNPKEEEQYRSNYLIGFKTGIHTFGFATMYSLFHKSNQYYKTNFAIYKSQYKEDASYVIGAGGLESSHQKAGRVVYFKWNWQILPTKKLF